MTYQIQNRVAYRTAKGIRWNTQILNYTEDKMYRMFNSLQVELLKKGVEITSNNFRDETVYSKLI